MQDLQPMQRSPLKSTMPSARLYSATVGQIVTQGGVGAVVAAQHCEEAPRIGELAFLDILDPGAKRPRGTSFSDLQAERAGVAADALAMVDDEPEFGQDRSFSHASVTQRGVLPLAWAQ